jgi:hypothetical protein
MRRRQLKWLWARLKQLSMMAPSREELLMKLGAARAHAPAAWRLVGIAVAPEGVTVTYHLYRAHLRLYPSAITWAQTAISGTERKLAVPST